MRMIPAQVEPAHLAAFVGAGAFLLVLGALGFEHWGGLAPCHLCLLQRGPLIAAAILGGTAAAAAPFSKEAARVALAAAAAMFLISTAIAVYHSGVERHWWAGPESCSGGFQLPTSAADLFAHAQIQRCDAIPWALFGLSLANYNVLLSAGLAALAGLGASGLCAKGAS